MKIILPNFTKNPADFIRSLGYAFEKEVGTESAFVKRISGHDYPKYHAYVHMEKTSLVVNLHIDQKQPSYGNNTAHSGDYDGPLVEKEVERIGARAEA